jgi:carbamoyl-phosphate synthase large subunit
MNEKKSTRLNILFSSAGRRVALINCFKNAARELAIDINIVAVDMDPSWSPGCQIADFAYTVDACVSSNFIPQVLDICKKHRINLIIPTIDTELIVYAEHREIFTRYGIEVHLGATQFVTTARDKEATARILKARGVPVPNTWSLLETRKKDLQLPFPLLLKPRGGSSSEDISIVSSFKELREKAGDREDLLIQEICRGQEYTINCFYDRKGSCVACVPHFRKFIRDGEVCFAQTERVPEFTAIAQQLSEIFSNIWGCICFQGFRQNDGSVRLFEINARFGGGYPICNRAGGTFAKWILQDLSGLQPDYHDNWQEGVRMLRYDDAVFTGDS